MTIFAQQKRPYDAIMKDVNATFASLKKNLDSNSLSSAAEDAARLQDEGRDRFLEKRSIVVSGSRCRRERGEWTESSGLLWLYWEVLQRLPR